MVEDFVDLATLKAMRDTFRDYDLEWEFIKCMDCLYEIQYPHAVLVIESNPNMVGWNWILVFEATNDNALGAI